MLPTLFALPIHPRPNSCTPSIQPHPEPTFSAAASPCSSPSSPSAPPSSLGASSSASSASPSTCTRWGRACTHMECTPHTQAAHACTHCRAVAAAPGAKHSSSGHVGPALGHHTPHRHYTGTTRARKSLPALSTGRWGWRKAARATVSLADSAASAAQQQPAPTA